MKRRFFEPRAPKIINFGWEHGRYADYWSALHFLTGLFLGALGIFIGLSLSETFFINLVLAILYEGVEAAFKVSEDIQNVFTDVVLVAVGTPIVFSLFPAMNFSQGNLILFICAVLCIDLILLRQGWNKYLKEALKNRRKKSA